MESPFPPRCTQRFKVERLLAQGGFGAIYLATQIDLSRSVAVKLLHADVADPVEIDRFTQEGRVAALLAHPHVATVFDADVEDGRPWIAFEYVAGMSLRQRMDQGGLSLTQALEASRQVALALEAAHARGIIHRDIKPANVLESAPGHWKVTDFGIAKWCAEGAVRTRTGLLIGTPAYISPEQIAGQPATERSDIYSLGIMLYELVVGHPPFRDENLAAILEHHLATPVPLPGTQVRGLPIGLDALLARALSKRPEERYVSASALRTAIEELLDKTQALGRDGERDAAGRAVGTTETTLRTRAGPSSATVRQPPGIARGLRPSEAVGTHPHGPDQEPRAVQTDRASTEVSVRRALIACSVAATCMLPVWLLRHVQHGGAAILPSGPASVAPDAQGAGSPRPALPTATAIASGPAGDPAPASDAGLTPARSAASDAPTPRPRPLTRDEAVERVQRMGGQVRLAGRTILSVDTRVSLFHAQVDDAGLREITAIPDISDLDLTATEITDDAGPVLQSLQRLQSLALNDTRIGNSGLSYIVKLPFLNSLEIAGTRIDAWGIHRLKEIPHLQSLTAGGPGFTREMFSIITQMRGLRALSLQKADLLDADLRAVGRMVTLEEFMIPEARIRGPGLASLSPLRSLRHLDLSGCPLEPGWTAHLPRGLPLEELALEKIRMSAQDLEYLSGLPHLKTLILCGARVDGDGWADLRRAKSMQYLLLDGTTMTDKDMASLAHLASLAALSVPYTRLTEAGMAGIRALAHQGSLERIRMSDEHISPEAIAGLRRDFPYLRVEILGTKTGKSR